MGGMLKKNKSINDLIKDTFYWNSRFGMMIFAVLISITTLWFLQSDQKSGCTVALSVLNQYKNSISRELELENVLVAKENFTAFITELNKLGIKNQLDLGPATNNMLLSEQDFCSVGFMSSKVKIPLQFASNVGGVIEGKISYFPSRSSLITMWFIVILLAFLLRRIETGIKIRLNKEIIDPIKSLSREVGLNDSNSLREVDDINQNFRSLREQIIANEKTQSEILSAQEKSLLAAQVAHDIRSPLAALDMITSDLTSLPEEKRIIIKSSVLRIKDIANGLIAKNQANNSGTTKPEVNFILPLVEEIMTEKRIQYENNKNINLEFEIGVDAYDLFGFFNEGQFKRVISNIIDNSVDACEQNGKIVVSLSKVDNQISISITDNGKGIPADVIPRLMIKGFSYEKPSGSGLGLYHAKEMVESWKGTITLISIPGKTEVSILLPMADRPMWFASTIVLRPKMKIVVIDDDSSVHHIWDQRFSDYKTSVEVFHCYNLKEAYCRANYLLSENEDVLFLCDYELAGDNESGLDFIEKLNISRTSLLVTSRASEMIIQARASRHGLKILPKSMAGFVKINFKDPSGLRVILIDDDELVRRSWSSVAERKGTLLTTFENVDDFEKEMGHLSKETVIYIDSNLGNGVKGEIYAKKIYDFGIKNIVLTTGYNSAEFKSYPWISEVIGKVPPW